MPKVTESLYSTVETNPHIEHVHFTEDGNHHFRVFKHGNDLYSRLEEVPVITKAGISTGKFDIKPIQHNGKDHADHKITATMTREQVLKSTPVKDAAQPLIKKADILDILGITEDDLTLVLKTKKGK